MKKIIISVFVLSIFLPTLAFASFNTSLKYGSKGSAVTELQDFLQNQGVYSGNIDGWFGLGTLKAVETFQSANGLQADGYFGIASRTKANSILATILAPSNAAEQAETGTITSTIITQPTLDSRGCSATSLFSSTTGQPCNTPIQPTTSNLPIIYNAPTTVPTATTTQTNTPTVDIKANGTEGTITVVYGAKPVITWTTKGMSGCSITNSNGGMMTGNLDNTSGTAPWTDGTTTVQCNIVELTNGDMVNKPSSDSVTINVDQSTVPPPPPSPSMAISSNLPDSTIQENTSQQKIGSFILHNQSTFEAVDVNSILVNFYSDSALTTPSSLPSTDLSMLTLGGISGNAVPIKQVIGSNIFGTNLTIPIGGSQTIDIYANIGTINGQFFTSLLPIAVGDSSRVSITSTNIIGIVGEKITIQ